MKDKLISFFSRFKLMIVDILIISASWEFVVLVSHTSISSMDLLAKLKEARYNMARRTETVIFKKVRAWRLPITRPSSSARRC